MKPWRQKRRVTERRVGTAERGGGSRTSDGVDRESLHQSRIHRLASPTGPPNVDRPVGPLDVPARDQRTDREQAFVRIRRTGGLTRHRLEPEPTQKRTIQSITEVAEAAMIEPEVCRNGG